MIVPYSFGDIILLIQLLILIAGMALAIVGIVVSRLRSVKMLEKDKSKNETIAESWVY